MGSIRRYEVLFAALCVGLSSAGCGDAGSGPTWDPTAENGEADLDSQSPSSVGIGEQTASSDEVVPPRSDLPPADSSVPSSGTGGAVCEVICRRVVAMGCAASAECVSACHDSLEELCGYEQVAVMDCAISREILRCDVEGDDVWDRVGLACETEVRALTACEQSLQDEPMRTETDTSSG